MTSEGESNSGGLVQAVAADVVGSVAGANIPEPIKKNFFKAFGQLCTAGKVGDDAKKYQERAVEAL